jgi:CelD/BcsL family acetyltransferase involved in cellulose biosynthesis/glycosyltransferase involved in cell wall biosynthesis
MLQSSQWKIYQRSDRGAPICAGPAPQLSVTSDLASIEHEWRCFERHADCTPFQTFDWLNAWQRCVGAPAGVKAAVVVGRQKNGEPLFILPLAIEQMRLVRRLVFLGHALCDYNAPLLAAEFADLVAPAEFVAWWRSAQSFLDRTPGYRHDLVLLDKMPERVGQQANPLLALGTVNNPSSAHLTRLGEDWESFYAGKRSSTRQRRDRKRRKRLAEDGALSLITANDPTDLRSTLNVLFTQKSRILARAGVPNILAGFGYSEFFVTVAAAAPELVHVSRLETGSKRVAAANLGLLFRGCYYQVLASYDDSLASIRPGTLHLQELMRYAIAQGCKYFDFTIGDEPYKLNWADRHLKLYDYVAATRWFGRAAATQTKFALRVKRFIKRSPLLLSLIARLRSLRAWTRLEERPAAKPCPAAHRSLRPRSIVFLGTAHDNGGSSILAGELAEAMRAQGHHVEEWYLFGPKPAGMPAGARVFHDGPRAPSFVTLAALFVRVIAALRARKPDAVYGLQSLANLIAGVGGRIAGVRNRVPTYHIPSERQNRTLMRLDNIAGRLGFYTRMIACAHSVAETYRGAAYAGRLIVVANGQKKPTAFSRADARSELGLPSNGIVIGQIGRFGYQKNQIFTLDLLKDLPGAVLLLVGAGPENAAVQAKIVAAGLQDRVRIVSAIDHARIGLFYAAVDVVVFPSRFEGLSLAAIEAIHAGVPPLCSDIPSFHELFRASSLLEEKLIVPLADRGRWLAAIRDMASEAGQRARVTAELARLSPTFLFDHMAKQYLAAWTE